jgi:hypothetical protein
MAQLSKQALKVENNTSFPNNTTNYITPAILRDYNTDIIDSMVDENTYIADSGSWNAATASLYTSASLALVTASVSGSSMTFVKGNGTTFSVTLPAGSGSATIPAGTISGSAQITALGFVSSSVTASSLITASVNVNVLTFTKGDGTQFNLTVAASGSAPAGTVSGSAQIVGLGFLQTSSFNAYTASQSTASIVTSISNLNTFTASAQTSINALNTNSASVNTSITNINTATSSLFTSASLGLTTASVSGTTMTFTKGNGTTFNVTLPTGSGGGTINTSSFATTGSNQFYGAQYISGNINIQGSSKILFDGGFSIQNPSNEITNLASSNTIQFITEPPAGPGGTNDIKFINRVSGSYIAFINERSGSGNQVYFQGGNAKFLLAAASGSNGKLEITATNVEVNTALTASALVATGPLTASLQQGYTWVGNGANKTSLVATSSFGGGGSIPTGTVSSSAQILNYGIFVTTGSSTANQAISGAFGFNTTKIVNDPATSQGGGSNVIYVDYGIFSGPYGNDFSYWGDTSYSNVKVNGTGVTNATVTNVGYGTYLELTISAGTVTNGATYTFTGPALQTISITGSLAASKQININPINGNTILMDGGGFTANTAALGGYFGPAIVQVRDITNNNILQFAASSSAMFNGGGQWDGPQIAAYQNDLGDASIIGFQTDTTWTDGRVTILTPLVAQSGSIVTGSLSIASGSSFYANGNKQFNVGAFQSNISQSGSANVSQSMKFDQTDISQGVSIVSNSRITLANAGTYNIQFSVQIDRVSGSGTDTVNIWLKKNGVNVTASAGAITISGGALAAKAVAAWNYVVNATANDYYELAWQTTDSNIQLINANASGNVPSIPSIILTVTQVR